MGDYTIVLARFFRRSVWIEVDAQNKILRYHKRLKKTIKVDLSGNSAHLWRERSLYIRPAISEYVADGKGAMELDCSTISKIKAMGEAAHEVSLAKTIREDAANFLKELFDEIQQSMAYEVALSCYLDNLAVNTYLDWINANFQKEAIINRYERLQNEAAECLKGYVPDAVLEEYRNRPTVDMHYVIASVVGNKSGMHGPESDIGSLTKILREAIRPDVPEEVIREFNQRMLIAADSIVAFLKGELRYSIHERKFALLIAMQKYYANGLDITPLSNYFCNIAFAGEEEYSLPYEIRRLVLGIRSKL